MNTEITHPSQLVGKGGESEIKPFVYVRDKLPPVRAFSIELKVGGDTKEDAVALLREFANSIDEGQTGTAHGGPSSGGFFDVKIDPEMTHDKYIAVLEAYLEKA